MPPTAPTPHHRSSVPPGPAMWLGKATCSASPRELLWLLMPLPWLCTALLVSASCPGLSALSGRASHRFLFADPVSRKNVKSAHSTRNRYSSQWTLTKCQASTPARTLTSDWRTVGSQHGVTVTESDSYSASLSQDTGEPRALPASCSLFFTSPTFQLPLPSSQPLPTSSWGPRHKSASLPAGH